jgi:hypothetical protein
MTAGVWRLPKKPCWCRRASTTASPACLRLTRARWSATAASPFAATCRSCRSTVASKKVRIPTALARTGAVRGAPNSGVRVRLAIRPGFRTHAAWRAAIWRPRSLCALPGAAEQSYRASGTTGAGHRHFVGVCNSSTIWRQDKFQLGSGEIEAVGSFLGEGQTGLGQGCLLVTSESHSTASFTTSKRVRCLATTLDRRSPLPSSPSTPSAPADLRGSAFRRDMMTWDRG